MIRALWLAACLIMVGATGARAQNCPVPNLLQNGTIADAAAVMSNFNTISTCIQNIFTPPIAVANASVAALTADQGILSSQYAGSSANQILKTVDAGTPKNADGIRSAITAPSGSTVTNTTAIAGYLLNNQATSGGFSKNAVSLFGIGISNVNSAFTWGINTVMQDAAGLTGVNLQNEFDCNVLSASTKCFGLVLTGASTAQPTTSAGFVVAPLNVLSPGTSKWGIGLWTEDASASIGIQLGAAASAGASVSGQPMIFQYYDSGSTLHNISLQADASAGTMDLISDISAISTGLQLFNNVSSSTNTASVFQLNTLSGVGSFVQKQVSSSSASLTISESGTGGVSIAAGTGGLFLSGLPGSPGGKNMVCVDGGTGQIYAGTTTTC